MVSERKITLVLAPKGSLEFTYDSRSNLPLMLKFKLGQSLTTGLRRAEVNFLGNTPVLEALLSVADEINQNLTGS